MIRVKKTTADVQTVNVPVTTHFLRSVELTLSEKLSLHFAACPRNQNIPYSEWPDAHWPLYCVPQKVAPGCRRWLMIRSFRPFVRFASSLCCLEFYYSKCHIQFLNFFQFLEPFLCKLVLLESTSLEAPTSSPQSDSFSCSVLRNQISIGCTRDTV